jgi:hypothetical protein
MELASEMKRDAVNVRSSRVKTYAEGYVQREINGAKSHGEEEAIIIVPANVDFEMIQDYIKDFGYDVVHVKERMLQISWENPKK